MSIYKELNTNPKQRDLIEFGVVLLVALGILGALDWFEINFLFFHGKHDTATRWWIAGAAIFVLSLIPPIGRLLYIAWMAFGLTIGLITSPIIMFVVYAVVIVPVGLVFKITGRDTMRRNIDANAKSYWEDYPSTSDPAQYVRQF